MACRLVGAKPSSDLMLLMLNYCQLEPEEHTSVKSLFKENAFKNDVGEMASILSRLQLVKTK